MLLKFFESLLLHLRFAEYTPRRLEDVAMKRAINWAVTATNPKSLSPDGIGRLDFDHVFWTESLIRRLICVECFRVASSKSLIGQGYTNASAVRQNLLGLLTENPEVHALFERCWTKTEKRA